MRKLVVSEYVTLDGVMEDPGGAEKTPHGGWTWPYWNDEMGKFKGDEMSATDSLLLGRKTYEAFAAAWPNMEGQLGADVMNNIPKYVASRTLKKLDWNNSRLLGPDLEKEVTKLKQQTGKNILVYGSSKLVHSLVQHNLVDDYWLCVYPVVVGKGKRLFGEDNHVTLKLLETKQFATGVAVLHYQSTATKPSAIQ